MWQTEHHKHSTKLGVDLRFLFAYFIILSILLLSYFTCLALVRGQNWKACLTEELFLVVEREGMEDVPEELDGRVVGMVVSLVLSVLRR